MFNFFKVAKATTVFIPIAKARGFPLAFRKRLDEFEQGQGIPADWS
jgi:hypothetical protein